MKTHLTKIGVVAVAACLMVLAGPVVALTRADDAGEKKAKDIVDTAAGLEDFTTLVKLIKRAELVDTLKGEGPFTVFAPTNKAFDELGQKTLADLMKPENQKKLQSILTYHVAPESLTASQVVRKKHIKTVNGQKLRIHTKEGKVRADGATIVKTDVMCSNGVIHVIDAVVMPKEKKK